MTLAYTSEKKRIGAHQHMRLTAVILFMLLFIIICGAEMCLGATQISGRFSQNHGQTIVLELNVSVPAPVNIIVEQYLQGNAQVIASHPKAKKIEQHGKVTKWLLRNIHSGVVSLQTTLDRPYKGKISAAIRYRAPESGKFIEIMIER